MAEETQIRTYTTRNKTTYTQTTYLKNGVPTRVNWQRGKKGRIEGAAYVSKQDRKRLCAKLIKAQNEASSKAQNNGSCFREVLEKENSYKSKGGKIIYLSDGKLRKSSTVDTIVPPFKESSLAGFSLDSKQEGNSDSQLELAAEEAEDIPLDEEIEREIKKRIKP